MHRVAKAQETEEGTKQNVLVDHLPEAVVGSSPEFFNGGETHDESGERSIGAIDGEEVDPLESSYYMIDKLLTKLINIGIERNECQIRRAEVVKELEKAKKLHDYVASISQHNSATIQRQGGAYILRNILP